MAKAKVSKKSTPAVKPKAKSGVKPVAKTPAKSAAKPAAKAVAVAKKAVVKASAKPETKPSKAGAKSAEKPNSKVTAARSAVQAAPKKAEKAAKPTPKALSARQKEVAEEIVEETPAPAAEMSDAEKASLGAEKTETKKKRKDDLKFDRTGDLLGQWQVLFDKSKGVKPAPYKMSENYEARTALQHKVLGWGYVLTSQNNRLEVLFKEGIKILIANYKA